VEIALSLTVPGLTVPELASLAAWSESVGYRTAWTAEVAGPEAFVVATAAAGAARAMRIGVAVVPAYTRTPALLAMAAGSVSQALGGRPFRLGIGSSSETIVHGWNGVPFDRPVRRVRETVEAVRAGLSGSGDYAGDLVSMRRFRTAAPPEGPVEIFVGALGPRMLETAGAVGDGVCLNMMPARVVPRQLEHVRAGAEESGRILPDGFGVMARVQVMITDDVPAARDRLRRAILGPYLAQPVYNRFLRWMGFEEEAAAIDAGWAARDRDRVERAIHDGLVDDLAVVGPADVVRERLAEYGEAGVTEAAVSVLSDDAAVVTDTLRSLAPGA
jgi:probable F420-dependent oxidoreductase